jgi:16S rRNA (adenine1518-N6/adenine1519-N6)-dimethyltransferase
MTYQVKAKKHLGQHFLKHDSIAARIAATVERTPCQLVLEIGPGMGVLTKQLLSYQEKEIWVNEIDSESIEYLKAHFLELSARIIEGDFLKLDLKRIFEGQSFAVIGNFPYNISSQILFRVWEHVDLIPFFSGMFQKEVAERVAAPPGSKTYGILSVLLQQRYDIQYEFTVPPEAFNPSPKVQSGVLTMTRKSIWDTSVDSKQFKQIIKAAFNQRRKTLRNALKGFTFDPELISETLLNQRAEQLHYSEFEQLTKALKA